MPTLIPLARLPQHRGRNHPQHRRPSHVSEDVCLKQSLVQSFNRPWSDPTLKKVISRFPYPASGESPLVFPTQVSPLNFLRSLLVPRIVRCWN